MAPLIYADDVSDLLEYKIKTAFLFNFAKFIEWPAGISTPDSKEFTIGIIAPPKVAVVAKMLQNKMIKGIPVKIRFFKSLDEATPCNILFLSSNDEALLKEMINRFEDSPVLTVADTSGFASQGGVINFITVDNTIRFEINPAVAERKDLKISSKLLSLARIVGTNESKGAGE